MDPDDCYSCPQLVWDCNIFDFLKEEMPLCIDGWDSSVDDCVDPVAY